MKQKTCPCNFIKPCSYACTCSNKLMSGGCERCCAYGSPDQIYDKAHSIAKVFKTYKEVKMIPTFKFSLREDLKDQPQFLPAKGESKASGWDVRVALSGNQEKMIISPGQYIKIPLGFRAFCPEGWWFELKPRSSSFVKKHLHALYGVIDETYENEIVFAAQYMPAPSAFDRHYEFSLSHGEAIGQIIPVRRQEMIVESISNEAYDLLCKERNGQRGTGGFGSTSEKVKI